MWSSGRGPCGTTSISLGAAFTVGKTSSLDSFFVVILSVSCVCLSFVKLRTAPLSTKTDLKLLNAKQLFRRPPTSPHTPWMSFIGSPSIVFRLCAQTVKVTPSPPLSGFKGMGQLCIGCALVPAQSILHCEHIRKTMSWDSVISVFDLIVGKN